MTAAVSELEDGEDDEDDDDAATVPEGNKDRESRRGEGRAPHPHSGHLAVHFYPKGLSHTRSHTDGGVNHTGRQVSCS